MLQQQERQRWSDGRCHALGLCWDVPPIAVEKVDSLSSARVKFTSLPYSSERLGQAGSKALHGCGLFTYSMPLPPTAGDRRQPKAAQVL